MALVSALLFSSFSTIVFSMTFHIDFRIDQTSIEKGNENGIEEHSNRPDLDCLGFLRRLIRFVERLADLGSDRPTDPTSTA